MLKLFKLPVNFYNTNPLFKGTPSTPITTWQGSYQDDFVSNPLRDKYSAAQIEATAKTNPRIVEIARKYNLPLKVNDNELQKLEKGHLHQTRLIVAKMYSNLPNELKNEVNLKQIQDAAKYHDFGKVLIPDKILNKQGELSEKEWEVMEQHSELSYELLKGTGLDNRTLELIKYHHQDSEGNGYPLTDKKYYYGTDSQILQLADKYAALTEERSYKSALSREEALEIIQQDVANGLVSEEIYAALEKATI